MINKPLLFLNAALILFVVGHSDVVRAGTVRSGGQILFANNSTIVGSQFHAHLDELANLLLSSPELTVLLIGHSDQTAASDRAYNKRLSLNRANSVKNFLMRKGVQGDRIEVSTAGFDAPIANNDSPLGRAQNRRVEIKIVNATPQPMTDILAPPQPLSPLMR